MASRVIDSDRGYRELLRGLAELGEPSVYVGILQDKGMLRERREYKRTKGGKITKKRRRIAVEDPEAITLVEIATINEFGSEDGRVPERSFMRSTIDENEKRYQRRLDAVAGKTVDAMVEGGTAAGEAAMREGLGQLGLGTAVGQELPVDDRRRFGLLERGLVFALGSNRTQFHNCHLRSFRHRSYRTRGACR